MPRRSLRCHLAPALLALSLAPWQVTALELRPTTLLLKPGQTQAELWLFNEAPDPWQGRIQIYRWHQSDGLDHLQASTAVVASPALAHVPGGARQRIRLVLPAPLPGDGERAFRVLVEPVDPALPRYSLPLFVSTTSASRPLLGVRLARSIDAPCLQLDNPGSRRIRLTDLAFTDAAGRATSIQPGLAGYVLPGASVCWPLPARTDGYAGGRFQARRDGAAADDLGPIAAATGPGL